MSSWWQKKVLRYALRTAISRTGLLEDKALDLDNFDITIGRQNVIELKDVGLNIKRITKLAQLPPCLRLETARVISLRLTIPADFYQSSIVVEVDGVDIIAHLEEEAVPNKQHGKEGARPPATARAPQHRKMNRRLPSPPPYDTGGLSDSEEELHIPTTQEMAKSFLKEEPTEEIEELEAEVAAKASGVEESFVSESSTSDDVGTGMGIGVPGFLASFLQGIVDRFKLEVRNVQVVVKTEIQNDVKDSVSIAVKLKVGGALIDKLDTLGSGPDANLDRARSVSLRDISLDILSEDSFLTELSDLPSQTSRTDSKSPARSPTFDQAVFDAIQASMEPTASTFSDPANSPASYARSDDGFRDEVRQPDPSSSTLDIRPGDDNISWGSRRSNASAPAEDLWKSMISEDDLQESLLIEPRRTGTPSAFPSRDNSPFAARLRRPVSPYDRTLQSPGSWPRLDESPQQHRLQSSPESWPAPEQSQHSAFEPLAQVLSSASQDVTDNRRDALALTETNVEQLQTPPERQETPGKDMLESRVFSHEEAQSMYMSAMTGSPKMKMPGGWASDVLSDRSESPDAIRKPLSQAMTALDGLVSPKDIPNPNIPSGNATPRAQTPVPLGREDMTTSMTSRELLFIDRLSLTIPVGHQSEQAEAQTQTQSSTQSVHGIPGTFSAYSEMSRSRWRGTSSVHTNSQSVLFAPKDEPETSTPNGSIEVTVDSLSVQVDISTGRLLYAVSSKAIAAVEASVKSFPKAPATSAENISTSPACSLHLARFKLCMFEQFDGATKLRNDPIERHGTIDVCADLITFQQAEVTKFGVQTLRLLLGGESFFCIDGADTSSEDCKGEMAISLDMSRNTTDVNGRPITGVHLQTGQLQITVDLESIDNTFGSFGGLSGILELGNSVLTESGANSPVASKVSKAASKGVRFAGDGDFVSSGPELKVNGTIGGVFVVLRGPSCSLMAKTGTVKAIYRESGIVTTVKHASLNGPFVEDHTTSPANVDVAGVRLEFHNKPQDKDLERLLSLLTPSRDKFDNDDDILVDTLLRQRRKGALLRVIADDVKAKVDHWEFLATVSALAKDLNKLSAVAKYLPEDERPGVLSLVRLKSIEARLPVNDRFGKLRISVRDLHLAHVGVPPLLAFSIGSVDANQVGGPTLIHTFIPLAGGDNLPVIMARMLGDDAVKIKLFNLAAEYNVPVILDLTSMDKEKEPAEMAAHLAQSVANLALNEVSSKASRVTDGSVKKMQIDVLVHDLAVGLTPQKLPSKAVFVLHDAKLSTEVPPSESMGVDMDLRRASLYITEQVVDESAYLDLPSNVPIDGSSSVSKALTQRNFVSIGTMRAAKIKFEAKEGIEKDVPKTIEVDVSIDLLLLETCADSTQTLFATLGALAPPTPPSKEPKYLTEPIPMEDLMKSFSGEALAVPRERNRPPSVLYDAENPSMGDEVDSPSMSGIGASMLEDEPDDLLFQSQMADSLYGPASGILGMENDAGYGNESTIGEDYPETAESLLEEDPFEMAEAPVARMGDAALVRDLGRQCKPAVNEQAVDLGLYEVEDLGYDALTGQQALGDANRFNAPHVGGRSETSKALPPKVPFRLRLRDSNIIWHLHDGYDWQRTRDGIAEVVEQVEQKAEERRLRRRHSRNEPDEDESIIGDVLFNSIYIGVAGNQDPEELRRRINHTIDEYDSETASVPGSAMSRPTTANSAAGQPTRHRQRRRLKLGRTKSHKLSFELKGMAVDVVVLPPGGEVVSSIDIRLTEFEIYDRLPSSTWRKFLTHRDDPSMREMSKPMFHIKMDNVKTIRSHAATDIMLHVTALPLRLHVDQDAQQFMLRFFAFKDETVPESNQSDEDKPYISRIEVDDVELRLDYKPKNLDWMGLRAGKTSELMNVVTLEGANILLRHAIVHGVGGFDQLHPKLDGLWTPDVIKNQLPQVVSGVAALRSLVNIGVGVRDTVAIPIKEYKKDGRIVRSIQKGAYHFGKTTTSELARLGAKVALGTQTFLSSAEEMLSPTEPSTSRPGAGSRVSSQDNWHDIADTEETEKPAVSAYSSQPIGVMSGLRSARKYLEHDLLTARDALIAVQGEFLESRTPGSAAAAVARHAPTVILRPVIGATRAVGTTLLGVGNAVDRGNLRRVEDKYKPR